MDPLISLRIREPRRVHYPGDVLEVEYQVDAIQPRDLQAIEASVLWYTEGKGDEDLGVHYFERRVTSDTVDGNLCQLYRFPTQLPNSPLSYWGMIIRIRWCVRVRVFLRGGREVSLEHAFQLGNLPPAPVPA